MFGTWLGAWKVRVVWEAVGLTRKCTNKHLKRAPEPPRPRGWTRRNRPNRCGSRRATTCCTSPSTAHASQSSHHGRRRGHPAISLPLQHRALPPKASTTPWPRRHDALGLSRRLAARLLPPRRTRRSRCSSRKHTPHTLLIAHRAGRPRLAPHSRCRIADQRVCRWSCRPPASQTCGLKHRTWCPPCCTGLNSQACPRKQPQASPPSPWLGMHRARCRHTHL